MAYSNSPASDCNQSDYSSACRLTINGSAQERKFLENLVVESIELYGQDVYYLPRTYVGRDNILDEIDSSKFETKYTIAKSFEKDDVFNGLNVLLYYFEKREEYEKCATIKKYQDLLEKEMEVVA